MRDINDKENLQKMFTTLNPDSKKSLKNDSGLNNNKTDEEKFRDNLISDLLLAYVKSYKSKVIAQKCFRFILFTISMMIVIAFATLFISLLINFDLSSDITSSESLIGLISVCVTFLTSIIGILKIIVKYCFPENDEQYITDIVKAVQENDLENKKENLKHKLYEEKQKDGKKQKDMRVFIQNLEKLMSDFEDDK